MKKTSIDYGGKEKKIKKGTDMQMKQHDSLAANFTLEICTENQLICIEELET